MGVPGVLLMIDPVLFQLGPFAVRWYGLCMALSVGVGFYYLLNGGRRLGCDDDFLYNLAFFVVLSGIVGARAVYVATNWSIYAQEPWAIWRIDLGGLSFHGAVIGGILGAWPYLRRHGASFSALADHAVPGLAFGIAIVRWANLINQEAMGRVTAQGFVHPTQIYGSAIGVVLLAINAYLSRRQPPPGYLFWSFVLYYSILRGFVEETFRANPLYAGGWVIPRIGAGFFTLTQLLTPVFIGLAWWMRKRTLERRQ
ncbi:MAG: prolipoprotein diacylglyceryl transferase [Limnochordia bacterium]|jgi:phosphatidylglycerol:prolipoprotein diacylglycerol transferase